MSVGSGGADPSLQAVILKVT